MLGQCRINVGSMLDQCRINVGSMLDQSRINVWWMLDRCRINVVSMSDQCRINVGSMSYQFRINVRSKTYLCWINVKSMLNQCCINAGSMLVHRVWRWPNIYPTMCLYIVYWGCSIHPWLWYHSSTRHALYHGYTLWCRIHTVRPAPDSHRSSHYPRSLRITTHSWLIWSPPRRILLGIKVMN